MKSQHRVNMRRRHCDSDVVVLVKYKLIGEQQFAPNLLHQDDWCLPNFFPDDSFWNCAASNLHGPPSTVCVLVLKDSLKTLNILGRMMRKGILVMVILLVGMASEVLTTMGCQLLWIIMEVGFKRWAHGCLDLWTMDTVKNKLLRFRTLIIKIFFSSRWKDNNCFWGYAITENRQKWFTIQKWSGN